MARARRFVIVKGGYRRVVEAVERYRLQLYRYTSLLSGTGYYLKPVHIVYRTLADGTRKKYYYYGRYWYRLERRNGRLVWRYVGTSKPRELSHLPDPPPNPLEGLSYARVGDSDDIILEEETYKRFKWLFEGLEVLILEVVGRPAGRRR